MKKAKAKAKPQRPVSRGPNGPSLSLDENMALDEFLFSEARVPVLKLMDQALTGQANDFLKMEGTPEEIYAAKLKLTGAQDYVRGIASYLEGRRKAGMAAASKEAK